MKRRTFGKRFFSALAALVAAPFVKPEKKSLTAAELKRIAEQNPPPPEWHEGESEYSFNWSHTIRHENGRTECYENGKLVCVIELSDRGVGTF